MKFLVAFSCLLAVACASGVAPVAYTNVAAAPVGYAYSNFAAAPYTYAAYGNVAAAPVAYANIASAPVAYSSVSVAQTPYTSTVAHVATPVVAAPVVQKTQYHAQNELGQASYGHSEPFQTHNAVQDAAGNKVGSYSYVAPNGQVIAANYVADGLGYRVASNALPVAPAVVPVSPAETPEVAAARAAHLQEHAIARGRGKRSVVAAYSAPVVHSAYAAPVVHTAYAAPVVQSAYVPATVNTVVNTPGHAVSYNLYYGRG